MVAAGSICWAAREAGADRLEHRQVGIAIGAMKRPVAERGGDGIGFVAEDDDHVVADRADGVVSGGDERLLAVGGRPRLKLLRAAHASAAAGGEDHTDAAMATSIGQLLAADIRLRDRLGRG